MSDGPTEWHLHPLMDYVNSGTVKVEIQPGKWVPCRPLGAPTIKHRLSAAWAAFTGRADVLYWPGQ